MVLKNRKSKKIETKCSYCNNIIYIYKSKKSNNNFCDVDCYNNYKRQTQTKTCVVCGETSIHVERLKGVCYCKKHYLQMLRHGKILERTIYDPNEIILHDEYAEMLLYDKYGNEVARTKIDLDDVEKCSKHKWKLTPNGYCRCTVKRIQIHNFITQIEMIDHINRNPLDNRKSNLRATTNSKNAMNTKLNSNNSSGHKGVYWYKQSNKWGARIMLNYKCHHLGYFDNINDAIRVRKDGELKYHNMEVCG